MFIAMRDVNYIYNLLFIALFRSLVNTFWIYPDPFIMYEM
jgi:hypothetical protein